MARTAQPLVNLLSGVVSVTSALQTQVGTQNNVVFESVDAQKSAVKVLDQLARALRKVPVAAKTE